MVDKYVLNTFPYWIYGENKIASHDKLNEWLDQNGIDYDNSFKVNELNKNYDICIFTGYDIEYVKNLKLQGIKYYKCGKFDISQQRKSMKTDEEYVLASPNQNFYDGNYKQLSTNGILKFKQFNGR